MEDRRELLRKIPKIDGVPQDGRLFFLMESTLRVVVVNSVEEVIDELRRDILGGRRSQVGTKETLMMEIMARITGKKKKSPRRVINAAGMILYTNLGGANLSDKTYESIMDVVRSYINLEHGMKCESRGLRHDHMEKALTKITGAEAAAVVNNNTAATMFCLSTLAKDKEITVSRRELVETGGSFRVPEIMEQNSARLMDAETTNKTKPSDHLSAYHEGGISTLMRVHTSNYRILDFTQEVELSEMVGLGEKLNLPVIYDVGSSLVADLTDCGVGEPTVLGALKTSINVALFSGGKLLDGPQGGIIAGKKEYIDKMKAHPLARTFRVDKMALAAMEATFFEHSDIRQVRKTIPVLSMITAPTTESKDEAEKLAGEIRRTAHHFTVEVEACKDQVDSDFAPTALLDGCMVAVWGRTLTPEKIERPLRKEEIPVITRTAHNQVYLDVGTIREDEFEYIVAVLTTMDSRQVKG